MEIESESGITTDRHLVSCKRAFIQSHSRGVFVATADAASAQNVSNWTRLILSLTDIRSVVVGQLFLASRQER